MHAIWLRKTVLLFLFGIFFAASLVWFVADYASKSRASALSVQVNPNPGSVIVSANTTATTTLTLEAASGQVISAYDLRFVLDGPLYIQSATKPVLVGSSLSQESITQFILSENRVSYGFIGAATQLSQRVEQPIVIACDGSGKGTITLEKTSQIVGSNGALELASPTSISVDCQGSSGLGRPSNGSSLVLVANPSAPQAGGAFDVVVSLPATYSTASIASIAMQLNYDPAVISLLSVDTPAGTLIPSDASTPSRGGVDPVPVEPGASTEVTTTTTSPSTVNETQVNPASDVQGVSTLAQNLSTAANPNTGPDTTVNSQAPSASCQSDADCPSPCVATDDRACAAVQGLCLNGICQKPVSSGESPDSPVSSGSLAIAPEGTAVVKMALSPSLTDPQLTLHFQGITEGDPRLSIESISYTTVTGENLSLATSRLTAGTFTSQPEGQAPSIEAGAVGDVNGDGVINSVDLLIIKDFLGSSDEEAITVADFNTDGAVNVQDYSMVINSFVQQ